MPKGTKATKQAAQTWATVNKELSKDPHYRTWIKPLSCAGEARNSLVLVGEGAVIAGFMKRYQRLMGDTIRATSEFDGFFISNERKA